MDVRAIPGDELLALFSNAHILLQPLAQFIRIE
jgi:hypothetical protein